MFNIPPEEIKKALNMALPIQKYTIFIEMDDSESMEAVSEALRRNLGVRVWGEWRQMSENERVRDGVDLHVVGNTLVFQPIMDYQGPIYHRCSYKGPPFNVWTNLSDWERHYT